MSERFRLILMRHAKSSHALYGVSDHERPLNERGRRDAPRVAEALRARAWMPELVLHSSAARAVGTWQGMANEWAWEGPVEEHAALYHAGMGALRRVLQRVDADRRAVLVIGHNPGWEEAVAWLTGEVIGMGTATAALMAGEGADWAEAIAEPERWRLVEVIRPKLL